MRPIYGIVRNDDDAVDRRKLGKLNYRSIHGLTRFTRLTLLDLISKVLFYLFLFRRRQTTFHIQQRFWTEICEKHPRFCFCFTLWFKPVNLNSQQCKFSLATFTSSLIHFDLWCLSLKVTCIDEFIRILNVLLSNSPPHPTPPAPSPSGVTLKRGQPWTYHVNWGKFFFILSLISGIKCVRTNAANTCALCWRLISWVYL